MDLYPTDYDKYADVYSIVTSLCYGKNNYQDLIEFCGGEGGISELAFTRGLSSAGNLDKVKTKVDLGCPKVQRVIEHFMETCYVLVAVLEMNCRSTGPRSYMNAQLNPDTWYDHHKTDLPHIKFNALNRFHTAKYEQVMF